MKKFLLGSVALVAFVGTAAAADLPVRAPVGVARSMATYYDWSGFYLGAHVGGAWGNITYSDVTNTSTFGGAVPGNAFTQKTSGFIGGGQIGYNWQFNPWVLGIEGKFSGSTLKGTTTNFVDDSFTNETNFLMLITGRLGFAVDNWLFYGKGGFAGVNRKVSVSDIGTVSPGVGSGSATSFHTGWTAGAGIEYGLTRNWILGIEYDHVDVGSQNYELDGTDGGGRSYLWSVKGNWDIITARASYKFN
jgi:outer membrane immunogenic protein